MAFRLEQITVPDRVTLGCTCLLGAGEYGLITHLAQEVGTSRPFLDTLRARGRKGRVDSTVVETTIHHPTDSRILGDGVRVLSRLLRRATDVVGQGADRARDAFRSRTRSVRPWAQHLHRVARRKGEAAAEELQQAHGKLIGIAQATRRQAQRVKDALQEQGAAQAQHVAEQVEHFLPLLDQALDQATRGGTEAGQLRRAVPRGLVEHDAGGQGLVLPAIGDQRGRQQGLGARRVEVGLAIVSRDRRLPAADDDTVPALVEDLRDAREEPVAVEAVEEADADAAGGRPGSPRSA